MNFCHEPLDGKLHHCGRVMRVVTTANGQGRYIWCPRCDADLFDKLRDAPEPPQAKESA